MQTRPLDSEKTEALMREEKDVAEYLQDLLRGSSRINARKGGIGVDSSILSVPSVSCLASSPG